MSYHREVLPSRRRRNPAMLALAFLAAGSLASMASSLVASAADRRAADEIRLERMQHDVHWLGVRLERMREERCPPWRYVAVQP